MNHSHTTIRSDAALARARGFTLIEVMLAVVILGLGVLGLAALFAGAAGQQQRSSEINLSVGLARNAEALLTRNLGRLAGEGLQNIIDDGEDGHWFPAPSSRRDWSLLLDPDEDGRLFFLVRAEGRTVYTVSREPGMPPTQGLDDNDSSEGVFGMDRLTLPDSNIHPQGLRVRITIGEESSPGVIDLQEMTFLGPELPLDIEFQRPPVRNVVLSREGGDLLSQATNDQHQDFNVPENVPASVSNQSSTNPDFANFRAYVWMHLASPPANRDDVGYIEFRIDDLPMGAWIERITVDAYDWRNARIISLNDRFIFEDDDRYAGGRRPVMGYTVLLRTVDGGASSQLTIFTYSLSPSAIPRSNTENRAFIPPELASEEDNNLLIKYNNITLAYDEDRNQYYLQVPAGGAGVSAQKRRQVVTPGQILMMVNSETVDLGDTQDGLDGGTPGSDIPVRVIAQQRVGDNLRGYLNRPPRVNGRSPLRTTGSTAELNLLGFNLSVESLTSDRTEWRIRPVEARQFQLVFDN